MDWCEKHLQRGLKVVGTQEVYPDTFECEECFRGLPIKEKAKETKREEEKKMRKKIEIDHNELRRMHAQGLPDRLIGEELGCSAHIVCIRRKVLGLAANSQKGRPKRRNGSVSLPNIQRKTAKVVSIPNLEPAAPAEMKLKEIMPAGPLVESIGLQTSDTRNGHHAKARVVMFEIEGGDQTIMAAIETVKAALQR